MNISDFLERGNPGDREWNMEDALDVNVPPEGHVKPESKATKASKASISRSHAIITIVVLTAAGSLGLGLLAGRGSGAGAGLIVSSVPMTHPSTSELSASALDASTINSSSSTLSSIPSGGEVIASKSTHTYYLPWCTQVGQISKEDETVFATEQDAKTAGYTPGAGCKGI